MFITQSLPLSSDLAFPDLATRLGSILQGLKAVIAQGAAKPGPLAPLGATARLVLLWGWIGRLAQRFEAILAHPAPIRSANARSIIPRSASLQSPRSTKPKPPAPPRGWQWLLRAIPGHYLPGCAEQLRHLLRDPAMAALIAADPRAARLLRPLCRRLRIQPAADLPPGLFLPPRPRKRRHRPAPPPPRPVAKPSDAVLRDRFTRPPQKQYPHLPDLGARWTDLAPAPPKPRRRKAGRGGIAHGDTGDPSF